MKFLLPVVEVPSDESLPVRGAWIEMQALTSLLADVLRRSPCGERGLKSSGRSGCSARRKSLPVRGAWIEILLWCCESCLTQKVAPRAGSVD